MLFLVACVFNYYICVYLSKTEIRTYLRPTGASYITNEMRKCRECFFESSSHWVVVFSKRRILISLHFYKNFKTPSISEKSLRIQENVRNVSRRKRKNWKIRTHLQNCFQPIVPRLRVCTSCLISSHVCYGGRYISSMQEGTYS